MGDEAWKRAHKSGKLQATTLSVWVFMAGVQLDDLHLVRAPLLYVGLAGAILLYALAPPFLASRLLARSSVDRPGGVEDALAASLLRRRIALGLTLVALVAWLVLFSAGRTPRW